MKTLYHRNDPETSIEAAEKMVETGKLQEQEEWILSHIWFYCRSYSIDNFTAKEVKNFNDGATDKFYYQLQRRLSGLHRKGYIERTGEKRKGCAVWRLK